MTSQDLITRKEAREKGLKWYFTNKPCKYGHVDKRLVSSKQCYTCSKDNYKSYYDSNREIRKEDFRNWKVSNLEHRSEYMKDYLGEWKRRNNGKVNAACIARKRLIIRQTPIWANLKKIEEIYIKSSQISKSTGIIHHVDHIVPLQGELVCGLHVEWNLQIITAEENLRKNNKFEI